jgi:hypothetical protein
MRVAGWWGHVARGWPRGVRVGAVEEVGSRFGRGWSCVWGVWATCNDPNLEGEVAFVSSFAWTQRTRPRLAQPSPSGALPCQRLAPSLNLLCTPPPFQIRAGSQSRERFAGYPFDPPSNLLSANRRTVPPISIAQVRTIYAARYTTAG